MGLLSGLFGSSDADKQRKLQQKQINATYKFNKKEYKFGQRQAQQSYKFAKEGLKINRQNEKALIKFNYQTARDSARWQQAIQDYQYQSQLKQYAKSEQIYTQQLGFNQQAANRAFESEGRRLQDIITEQAYAKQELFTSLLSEEGEQLARGVSGKSVQKGVQSTIAQWGRNQAVLADSMVSAQKDHRSNLEDIKLSWYGANLSADANRMLKPLQMPGVPMPRKQPRSVLQNPLKPMAPPKPMKGVNTAPGGNWGSAIGGGLLSAGASVGGAALTAAAAGTPLGPLAIGASLLGAL
jgi:hypothetical protein